MSQFLAVCLSPTLQRTIVLPALRENEVNRATRRYLDAAGKGVNVARILTQLGAEVVHLTHAGGRDRDLLLDLATSTGVAVEAVESAAEIRTCTTLINMQARTTTEIVEEAPPVEPSTEEHIWSSFLRLVERSSVLIIGGSKSGGISDKLFPEMAREAKTRGVKVILDIRGKDLANSMRHRPDVIKPNLVEFVSTFLADGNDGKWTAATLSEHTRDAELLGEVERQMEEIYRLYGTTTVLTRGGNETLFWNGDAVARVRPEPLEPLNTIGCGDAFTAGFAERWAAGASVEEAVRAGNETAGKNARLIRPGTIVDY